MKIFIADKLSDSALNDLKALGAEITLKPDSTLEDLKTCLGDHEILIVRSTKVVQEAIANGTSLSLIIRAGAGVNNIDLKTASERGIPVCNCPGKNTDAVAELAMGLLVGADRALADGTADLRSGTWAKKKYGKASGLRGRTLGVIGLGSIGSGVAFRAKAFGMNVVAWSRSLTPERADTMGIEYCENPIEVAKRSDAVSVHLAAGADTKHMIDSSFFDAMKTGALFVNTARGEVVDTEALKSAIRDKGIKAALDVYEDEPGASATEFADTELASMIACGTHHIGASTDQASEAIASEVVNIVRALKMTGVPLHAVNLRAKTAGAVTLQVRHYNRVGVLAGVLNELRTADINIEEMENTIFAGGQAAACTLLLDDRPDQVLVDKIRGLENIIQVEVK